MKYVCVRPSKSRVLLFFFVLTSFFNNVVGISDPGQLNPPDFCPTEMTSNGEQPEDFISLFFKLQ